MNQRETARELVEAFQASLRARHPGLNARLMQRAEDGTGAPTWMEHYAFDPASHPQGVTADIQTQIDTEAEPLLACIDGVRHIEVFTACAS